MENLIHKKKFMTDPNTNVNSTDATDEIKPETIVEGIEENTEATPKEEVKPTDDSNTEEVKTDE